MQNIVARHVETSTSRNRRRGTWVGSFALSQGRWRCSSASLRLWGAAVWGGKEVMRCENSIQQSRGNRLYQKNKTQV